MQNTKEIYPGAIRSVITGKAVNITGDQLTCESPTFQPKAYETAPQTGRFLSLGLLSYMNGSGATLELHLPYERSVTVCVRKSVLAQSKKQTATPCAS